MTHASSDIVGPYDGSNMFGETGHVTAHQTAQQDTAGKHI